MRSLHFLWLFLFPCFMSCQQAQDAALPIFSASVATPQCQEKAPAGATNIIFQSTDSGKTWQDISAGLPQDLKPQAFFADKDELYLSSSNGIYRNGSAAKATAWEKEVSLEVPVNAVSAGSNGLIAFNDNGRFFQRLNTTGIWVPIFQTLGQQSVRNVFTARNGNTFIGSDQGIFKSEDQGKTWKHVMASGWMIHMAEADGVLLCTSQRGILRSTDGGEHWDVVLYEGGVGIAVEVIKGGFAAITYNTESETRRVRISSDGGKTWLPIDSDLPPSDMISSIKQLGDTFYCGHPKGIFRSDDGGKTWQLLLPTIGEKVFNLSVLGEKLYAVLLDGGC